MSPGGAQRYYQMAVDSLLTAAARDWAFDGERREMALEEASK